jgi:hypothetical protein
MELELSSPIVVAVIWFVWNLFDSAAVVFNARPLFVADSPEW